jgi:Protein of unknown function (DUF3617)
MNRFTTIAALAPFVVLAACSSQPSVSATNASMAEVAEKAKDALRIEPGEWQSKTQLLAFELPGVKDQTMANMMREGMKKQQEKERTYCVTAADAKRFTTDMLGGDKNGECRFDTFNVAAGVLSAKMTCKGKNAPGQMTMAMSGPYSPTSQELTVDMNMTNPVGEGGMTIKAKTTATRVSATCKPGTEKM